MRKPAHEIALHADDEPGGIAPGTAGELHQEATGLLGKAFSYVQRLLRMERRPWAVLLAAAFGVMLAVGHVVGGVTGLFEGYERFKLALFTEGRKLGVNSDPQLRKHARALAEELRIEFLRARDKLEQNNRVDFSRAEEVIEALRRVDDRSGHIWYFRGEIKRLKSPDVFTPKSCMKPQPPGWEIAKDFYQNDFYRYLELVKIVPAGDMDSDFGSEICYERTSGYCVQRVAWIHHLLANDYYQEALASLVPSDRVVKLKRAATHARGAHRYQDTEGVEGFAQCTATIALEQRIDQELAGSETNAKVGRSAPNLKQSKGHP